MGIKLKKINKLSVVIPIYKEGNNIIILTKKISRYIDFKKYEIIFVDDNSKDNTLKNFLFLKKKNKRVKLIIRKNKKKDLSKSCIVGFKKAKYKHILVMDGDLQHSPKYMKIFISHFQKYNPDIIVGCRSIFGESNNGLNLLRSIMSKILIFFLNNVLWKATSDPMSGFFLFKKKIFLNSKNKLFGKGYKILADLIYSNKNKLVIKDVNINFYKRKNGKSKMNLIVLFLLIQFIFKKILDKKNDKI